MDNYHICINTIKCPECQQMLCEKCLSSKGEECYQCGAAIDLKELRQRRNNLRIGMRRQIDAKTSTDGSFGTSGQTRDDLDNESVIYNGYRNRAQTSLPMFEKTTTPTTDKIRTSGVSQLSNEELYQAHPNADIFDIPTTDEFITFTKEQGNTSKIIQYATLEKCLSFMLSKEADDTYFLQCFAFTYKLVTTTEQLLKLLIILFNPNKPSEMEWTSFIQDVIYPTRAKIVSFLKLIIQSNTKDFLLEENKMLFDELIEIYNAYNESMAKNLKGSLQRCIDKKKTINFPIKEATLFNEDKHFQGIFLISPFTFAEQMTLLQCECFSQIPPDEFLNQNWTKKNKEELAPNLLKMIQMTNRLILIVQTTIVTQPTYAMRALAIYYFIKVADTMRQLQNFDGMKSIITALLSVVVFRLKASWEILSTENKMLFNELSTLCSEENNFAELRKVMKIATPPSIPFIGSTLTDLIYTNDGNKTGDDKEKINFYKLRGIGNLVKEIQMKQNTFYEMEVAPNVREYIENMKIITNEDEMFDISQKNEPKVDLKTLDLSKKPYKSEVAKYKDLSKEYKKKLKKLQSEN